jgi:hypothetical protein
MTEEREIPKRVTRFYGTVEYATDVLQNAQIAFVHVSMLNDPFDPYCFFETDFRDSYQNLMAHIRKHHPNDMPWFRAHVTPQSWGQTIVDLKAFLQGIRDSAFVLSTSAPLDDFHPQENLYMWGHYANGHRGLAIEYDTQALANAARKHHGTVNGTPSDEQQVWAEIEYAKTFRPISAENVYEFLKQEIEQARRKQATRKITALDAYYNRMTVIKSDVWQRENEWRLMWRNSETTDKIYKCPIEKDAITRIFLGLDLEADKAKELIEAARINFPEACLFQAQKKHGDLALEFQPI